MKLSKEEKYEIAQMTVDILNKQSEPKINPKWSTLRKEIRDYCQSTPAQVHWYNLQMKIYDAIRAVLNIKRIDDMNSRQANEARKIFEFIKRERQEWL